jgi:hypothetical protein
MPATEVSGMLICTGSSVSRLVPFTVTPVKLTEPKSVNGRTLEPPEVLEGASAMTSAEDRSAPVWVALIVCVQPCVMSSSTSRNSSLPWEVTVPVNLSPGLTGFVKFTAAPGKTSHQA